MRERRIRHEQREGKEKERDSVRDKDTEGEREQI